MPLNRVEPNPEAPRLKIRPVDVAKYRDLPEVKVPYTYEDGKNFKVPRQGMRPIYVDAVERAKAAFVAEGALLPIVFPEDAIRVQEYPDEGMVEFVFARSIAGEERFVRIPPYPLHPSVIGWLKATDRWS
jgi:hypothetical protein